MGADKTIEDAIKIIDANTLKIALVVDKNKKLVGTVTDGDIRRGILKGIALHEPVVSVMNGNPIVVSPQHDYKEILSVMRLKHIQQIPVVDNNNHVLGIEVMGDLIQPEYRENWVVLMAGGLGTRLSPLTDKCPKPLLKIGEKPLLETILINFAEYGFRNFYISVNYRAEMIEQYFGNGARWGVRIEYLRETHRMGTAGSLSLLPTKPNDPMLVMNGDLLTKVNFAQLLDFHIEHKAKGTMCVREYDFQIPYGVIQTEKHRLLAIKEKPRHRVFVNAGIYVIDPDSLENIPQNQYLDMPSLFERLIETKQETAVFPIREYWIDIGRMGDYEKANAEYQSEFCS